MRITKGEYKNDIREVYNNNYGMIATFYDSHIFDNGNSNANFYVACANACQKVSPEHPEKVAELIPDAFDALRDILKDWEVKWDDYKQEWGVTNTAECFDPDQIVAIYQVLNALKPEGENEQQSNLHR